MKRTGGNVHPDLGFQIAPMIDVMFVILLYFMVMAGSVKVEYEIKTTLPGSAEAATTPSDDQPPDEVIIGISDSGEVLLNDDPIGQPNDKALNDLYNEMVNLERTAQEGHQKIIVTVAAEETVKYERIMNVLDILAKARVTNVTFSATEDDDF